MEQMTNPEAQANARRSFAELVVDGTRRVLESRKVTRAVSVGCGAVAAAELAYVAAGNASINETIPATAITLGTALAVEFGWLSHVATEE